MKQTRFGALESASHRKAGKLEQRDRQTHECFRAPNALKGK